MDQPTLQVQQVGKPVGILQRVQPIVLRLHHRYQPMGDVEVLVRMDELRQARSDSLETNEQRDGQRDQKEDPCGPEPQISCAHRH